MAESLLSTFFLANVNIWGGTLFGYNTGIIAPAGDPLNKEFDLSALQKGIVVASILLGAIIGSLMGGIIANWFGRKKVLHAACVLTILGAASSAFSPNWWVLSLLRIILGIGVGLTSSVCPLYVTEMSSATNRGALGSLFQLSITFSIFLAYVIGYGLSFMANKYSWRTMFALGLLPAIVLILINFFTMTEPSKTEEKDAEQSLIRKEGSVNNNNQNSSMSDSEEIKLTDNDNDKSWAVVFSIRNIKPLILGIVFSVGLQFTGINAVIYYAPDIFKSAGVNHAAYATIGVGAWNFVTSISPLFFVDKLGRRPLFLSGMVVMTLADIILGISEKFIPKPAGSYVSLVCIFIFIGGFESGIGPLFWIIITEIFPPNICDKAGSLINVLQWLWNLILSVAFLSVVDKIGLAATYWIFGFVGLVCTAYGFFFLPETKGKERTQ